MNLIPKIALMVIFIYMDCSSVAICSLMSQKLKANSVRSFPKYSMFGFQSMTSRSVKLCKVIIVVNKNDE